MARLISASQLRCVLSHLNRPVEYIRCSDAVLMRAIDQDWKLEIEGRVCEMRTQTICSDCLIFEVSEAIPQASGSIDRLHLICCDCALQITDVLRASSEDQQGGKVHSMTEVMRALFEQLAVRKGDAQMRVIQHKKFSATSLRLAIVKVGCSNKTRNRFVLRFRLPSNKRRLQGSIKAVQLESCPALHARKRTPRENELLAKISDLERNTTKLTGRTKKTYFGTL
jgi:hypothetical protein